MSEVALLEGIYMKCAKGKVGMGSTSRESLWESLWLPYKEENGYVELYPVMDNLQGVMMFKEKVPVEVFNDEYSVMDDSRDAYLKLKSMIR
jgi:hypothetical protein